MKKALKCAEKSLKTCDVPVGAVIVKDNKIIATGYNTREKNRNALCHAEINAINNACKTLSCWRLEGCEMYVTLEPCPMCAGAILQSKISKVYFGAYEEKFGAVGSKFNLFYDYKFNFDVKFRGGILEEESSLLLKTFFENIR
ncbi:MAG: nucleoside deaminase [Clostridia bacterium]|nr:nucleoside deaminase [Clostridia bacterium]